MIFIVSWCYGGLAMVIFILFWQGSYPPWWHHTGICRSRCLLHEELKLLHESKQEAFSNSPDSSFEWKH